MAIAANAGSASADELDFQISIDGHDLIPAADTTASATSGTGDFAIAYGDGASATADEGQYDFAFANGANSLVDVDLGNGDVGAAKGADSLALVNGGNDSVALADGTSADLGNGIADVMPASLGTLIDPFLTRLLALL